jgi:hypothetical protein
VNCSPGAEHAHVRRSVAWVLSESTSLPVELQRDRVREHNVQRAVDDVVLDFFAGRGTMGEAATKTWRREADELRAPSR